MVEERLTREELIALHDVMDILAKLLEVEYAKSDLRRGWYGPRQEGRDRDALK